MNFSSATPLSIVHVLRAPVGGLFRHVVDLSREQAARGCRVGVIADSLTGGARADEVFNDLSPSLALGVHRIGMPRNPGPGDAVNVVRIARLLLRLAPDVTHGHGSKGGLYARAPRLLGARKSVRAYTPHGGSFHFSAGLQGAAYMAMERLLARVTDLFLFESAYIRDRFERSVSAPAERKFVTLNGIGDAEFDPVLPVSDAADFLYIGELRALKGVDTLLDALAAMARERAWTLNLVGAGPDEALLREHVRARGLGGRVHFLGAMPAREAFAKGRALVVPSRAESLPYVVIEAAAARIPIVATRVGGIPEIMAPFAYELIAPDDSAALAQAMLRLEGMQPDEKTRRADELATFVQERFTIASMTASILNAYAHAIKARRAAAQPTKKDS